MKAALDVHYKSDRSITACVIFKNWLDNKPREIVRVVGPDRPPYRPGRFFERELPCLLSALEQVKVKLETIVIDGFVHLRAEVGKGLGVHLYESLNYLPEIIGVAKNPLRIADRFIAIHRGRGKKPLYISAIGCSLESAARSISTMHGPYRLPTLLKLADQVARAG